MYKGPFLLHNNHVFLTYIHVAGNLESPSNLKLLLSCLSSLTVRNEYCQAVVKEHDGLKCMLDLLMDSNKHNKGIVTESLKLLKTLAGNDNVKKEIGESNGIHIIISAINDYVVRKTDSNILYHLFE